MFFIWKIIASGKFLVQEIMRLVNLCVRLGAEAGAFTSLKYSNTKGGKDGISGPEATQPGKAAPHTRLWLPLFQNLSDSVNVVYL